MSSATARAFDVTRLSATEARDEAERRRLLRERGLPFSSSLPLAELRAGATPAEARDDVTKHSPRAVRPALAPSTSTGTPAARAAGQGSGGGGVGVIEVGTPPLARRVGDTLELLLLFPPRTKKNSKEHLARQSVGYRRFRNQVATFLASWRETLRLPLPPQRYRVEALFYTDNDQADFGGLQQGLADALQDAGVIEDDRWFWSWDGTEQWTDPLCPRVELRITPLPSSAPRSLGLYRSWRVSAAAAGAHAG